MPMALPRHLILRRAYSLDIPTEISIPIVEQFLQWVHSSGDEWAVKRMKSLKQDFLNLLADDSAVIATPWVAKCNPRLPKGSLKPLFKIGLQSKKMLKQVIALFNIFTACVASEPLPSQVEKFKAAVQTPGPDTDPRVIIRILHAARPYQCFKAPRALKPLPLRSQMKDSHERRFLTEFYQDMGTKWGRHIMIDYWETFGQSMNPLLGPWSYPHVDEDTWTIGHIGITQNPGLKARFYAAPHIWVQHMLEPFGELVYETVKSLPWDATFDQTKAFPSVQAHLKLGKTAYCFDLTSATDRFPFDLQLKLIRFMFPHEKLKPYIDFFEEVSRKPFKLLDESVIWSHGQPLGLQPSFASFTLSHGMLLQALSGEEYKQQFFVLGDDVIILDETLAKSYELFLQTHNIPFEPTKTIKSNKFGEFAGKVILPDKVIPSLKWKEVRNMNSLDFIRDWGIQFLNLLPKSARPVIRAIAQLPEPYGLGINPKGLSLSERLDGFEEYLMKEDSGKSYLLSHRELVSKRFHYLFDDQLSKTRNRYSDCMSLADTFDQKISDRIRVETHSFLLFYPITGADLYEMYPDLHLEIERPASSSPKSPISIIRQKLGDILNKFK